MRKDGKLKEWITVWRKRFHSLRFHYSSFKRKRNINERGDEGKKKQYGDKECTREQNEYGNDGQRREQKWEKHFARFPCFFPF